MSAAKKITVVLALAFAVISLSAASVLAQAGAPNFCGGTSLRPAVQEGGGSILTDFLSRGLCIDQGLRSWLIGFAASRYGVAAGVRPVVGRTTMAIVRQRAWMR